MLVRHCAVCLGTLMAISAFQNAVAMEDAKRKVIEEACVGYTDEEKGPNGVLSPRQVQCRLSMGETYDEIADDIQLLQARKATRQRHQEQVDMKARERAEAIRKEALAAAPEICQMMVDDYAQGRWFATNSAAWQIFASNSDSASYRQKLTAIGDFMASLGHNYSEKYQRQIVLGKLTAPMGFDGFNDALSAISSNVRSSAQSAKFYEDQGRYSSAITDPPGTAGYAFQCFLDKTFHSLNADPFDRTLKLDQYGHVVE